MLDHFKLKCIPFTREIATRDCYSLDYQEQQISWLLKAVSMKMSALLMAPAGMGKTVILRRIEEKLPDAHYQVSYLKVSRLSGRDFCREIGRAIGARPAGNYPALMRAVQERMQACLASEGQRPIIMIDDAHSLTEQGFELLKLLSNFDMDSKLVVSFILAGHHDLKKKLHNPNLVDVRQRIIHCGELRLLSRQECSDYIKHRFLVAGLATAPIDQSAVEIIFEMSRGNMRAIDNLALKSLDQAEAAKDKTVGSEHVMAAGASLWT